MAIREAGMTTLEQLMTIDGVTAAFEFGPDGRLTDFTAAGEMPRDLAEEVAGHCAAVTRMFTGLSSTLGDLSHMQWAPARGWAYAGATWTLVVGDGGRRGVFVATSKADLQGLFRALGEPAAERTTRAA